MQSYTPARTVRHKEEVGWEARRVGVDLVAAPIPMGLACRFYMPIPKGVSPLSRHAVRLRHGDVDSLLGLVMDALTGIAWEDDAQVAFTLGYKLWADRDGPRTLVSIWRLV